VYKLYLDDIRVPTMTYPTTSNSEWVLARSYDEFVEAITNRGLPFIISFDHDLGEEHYKHGFTGQVPEYDKYTEKTGMECAKWLVEYCMNNDKSLPKCNVHSANPIGAENIRSYLDSFERSRQT
jgi:hypothetical protein